MRKQTLVFVYGTLKQGFHNHYYIAESEIVGTGLTVEKFAMYQDGIPYVTKDEVVSRIQCEVYSVDDETLAILDELEHYPCWYGREKVDVALDGQGAIVSAWLYFNDVPVGELVPSGNYSLLYKIQ